MFHHHSAIVFPQSVLSSNVESTRKMVHLLILLHHPELLRLHTFPPRGCPVPHIPLHQPVARVARGKEQLKMASLTLAWVIPDTTPYNSWTDGGQLPLQMMLHVRMKLLSRDLIVFHEVDCWWNIREKWLSQNWSGDRVQFLNWLKEEKLKQKPFWIFVC